jgi:PAS domain-containing protein
MRFAKGADGPMVRNGATRVMGTTGGRRLRLRILGARLTVEVTVVMATALLVLPFVDSHLSDVPLLLFMVAVGLCAARFGIPGGVSSGLGGAAIAALWYLRGSHYGRGLVDYLLQAVAFVVVGALVGSAASDRRDLERVVSRHSELSVDLICTATFDGFFTRLNPSWERVLGCSADELKGRPFLDFVHPDDLDATIEAGGEACGCGRGGIELSRTDSAARTGRIVGWSGRRGPTCERG